ncbi:C-type lectin domain family 10 member A-like isoform X1 [Rhinopithecus roxellana]|uniref:C-type lectin domain containing 10A n=1 Tax=Rhinopithecus bieti TaxID=61621 RepID=A0AAJ7DHK5_RHIBE|nr:PREDICTED: C-type lectin domain family 10 member A isoform X3 [Rhinopithecus bieti]XP_017705876.1 PREDICTED: C-type lectin domain family 10 member A isoform X3 [Rhinopithecus bieti]XP_030779337.1 C-type lectin domain family 10 member A isoform X1 [Rhinopithecus roxellana]XP_030779338.1 C-type lectin domain family 10 member A isoform X1 [Rhinopithecus roxellana]XP_030779627.1 C-type lectin domain family 10 member A-like isoform X1 [Rhinopithecus roxellana]
MTVTYENFQDLESEEKVQGVRNGLPPPQSLLQHLRSGPCLLLLSLGLGLLLLVIICVVGSQNSKFQRDLVTLRTDFSNFTSNTVAEIQALTSQGSSVEEMIASLKAEVEVIKQEQQAVHSEMLLRVQRLMQDLNKLTCQVATLKNNASTERTCCPINWVEHQDSCYWFSHSGMPWAEAEKHCQLEDAHLVVINSREEQNFVQEHLSFAYTWMGLSDLEGAWKWVDGTDYETGFQNWKPGQPDDWQGHGLGGGEDCAHFHPDGRWNDDVCQKPYYWVCEAGLTQASQESH